MDQMSYFKTCFTASRQTRRTDHSNRQRVSDASKFNTHYLNYVKMNVVIDSRKTNIHYTDTECRRVRWYEAIVEIARHILSAIKL